MIRGLLLLCRFFHRQKTDESRDGEVIAEINWWGADDDISVWKTGILFDRMKFDSLKFD
jgi:hypothetical protein